MYIKHLAVSANFKVVTFNNICRGLTGKCFETPNGFIYVTLTPSKKQHIAHLNKHLLKILLILLCVLISL